MPLLPVEKARSWISVRRSVLRLAAPEGGGRGGGAHAAQPRDLPGEDGEARGAAQENARGVRRESCASGGEGCREGGGEAASEDRRVGGPQLDGHGRRKGHGYLDEHARTRLDIGQQAEVELQTRLQSAHGRRRWWRLPAL